MGKNSKEAKDAPRVPPPPTSLPVGASVVVNVTSKSGSEHFRRFSPFFPHGDIKAAHLPNTLSSRSVEGLWQGLKVFDKDVGGVKAYAFDNSKFLIDDMKNVSGSSQTLLRRLCVFSSISCIQIVLSCRSNGAPKWIRKS